MFRDGEDSSIYNVVINDEKQYSICLVIEKMRSDGITKVNLGQNKNAWIILIKFGLICAL